MKKMSPNRTKMLKKQSIKGATLIEVLVSVFLLTFGILGLMAAQLRSVSAVSESENQAIAAQAAENLAEAMQVNPDLEAGGKRKYSQYFTSNYISISDVPSCAGETSGAKDACTLSGGNISKSELAQAQLGEFQYILKQMPNAVEIKYAICLANSSDTALLDEAKNPSLTEAKCLPPSTVGAKAVIKIVWSSLNNSKETATGVPETSVQMYYLVVPQ